MICLSFVVPAVAAETDADGVTYQNLALGKAYTIVSRPNNAADRVLTADGVRRMGWALRKDRAVADQVRIEVGAILEQLK